MPMLRRAASRSALAPAPPMLMLAFALAMALILLPAPAAHALTYTGGWGGYGTGNGQFSFPSAVAVSANGNVYITDQGNQRVQYFTAGGTYLGQWSVYAGGISTAPTGIAVNQTTGDVYVAESGGSRTERFSATGALLNRVGIYGSPSSGNSSQNNPQNVALDAAGNVYVADSYNQRIQVYGPDLTYQRTVALPARPYGVAVDAAGNVYVGFFMESAIRKYNSSGALLATWTTAGSAGALANPTGLAMTPAGNLLVADEYNNRVVQLAPDGSYMSTLPLPDGASSANYYPLGVTATASGTVYVTDSNGASGGPHRVAIYAPSVPDTTITTTLPTPVTTSTPSIAFTAAPGGASFQCRMDGGSFASCTSPYTALALSEGSHTFQVRAVGDDGPDPTPASVTFRVNAVAPAVSLTSGPSGTTANASPAFGFTSGDSLLDHFECRLGSDPYEPCGTTSPGTRSYSNLSDGPRTFAVRAVDSDGIAGTAVTRAFTVDTTAPQTSAGTGPAVLIATDSATVTYSSADADVASFSCRIDGGAWSACGTGSSGSKTYTSLADGSHTIEVRAVDAVDNADLTPASWTFTVDTTAPTAAFASGVSGPTADDSPTFTFTSPATDLDRFECRLDTGSWTACGTSSPGTESLTALADGDYTMSVRAVDQAGNAGTAVARSFSVDTTAPAGTTVGSAPTGTISSTAPTFTPGSNAGDVDHYECRLDGGPWTTCAAGTPPFTGLSDGTHTIDVRGVDAAGNADPVPASFTFTVDAMAPATTLVSSPAATTPFPSPSFTFESPDVDIDFFECRLDGGAWTTCGTGASGSESYAGLADGSHTFEVRAVDTTGNADATPATFTFTVDTVAPAGTTADAGPAGTVPSTAPALTFSNPAGDVDHYECRLDGGAWTTCTSGTAPYTGLADGPHTVEVRAVDGAGNADPSAISYTFTVDATAPGTTMVSSPAALTPFDAPAFTFGSSDSDVDHFECRIDGGSWTLCGTGASGSETLSGLADGPHTFQVRAVDAVGNADANPATFTFTVDTTPPTGTSAGSVPAGTITSQAPTFGFTSPAGDVDHFECRLDGGPWITCTTGTAPFTGLADGSHTIEVRGVDGAGNADPVPASFTFSVLRTPTPTAPPVVTGPVTPGGTLTAAPGAWDGQTDEIVTQWLRCDASGAGCAPIPGATGDTYVLTEADLGMAIRARVIAANAASSAQAESVPTDAVAAVPVVVPAPAPPAAVPGPQLPGVPPAGDSDDDDARIGAKKATIKVVGLTLRKGSKSASAVIKVGRAGTLSIPKSARFARGSLKVKKAGTVSVVLKLNAKARRQLQRRNKFSTTLTVRYTPSGARTQTVRSKLTLKRKVVKKKKTTKTRRQGAGVRAASARSAA